MHMGATDGPGERERYASASVERDGRRCAVEGERRPALRLSKSRQCLSHLEGRDVLRGRVAVRLVDAELEGYVHHQIALRHPRVGPELAALHELNRCCGRVRFRGVGRRGGREHGSCRGRPRIPQQLASRYVRHEPLPLSTSGHPGAGIDPMNERLVAKGFRRFREGLLVTPPPRPHLTRAGGPVQPVHPRAQVRWRRAVPVLRVAQVRPGLAARVCLQDLHVAAELLGVDDGGRVVPGRSGRAPRVRTEPAHP